MSRITLPGDYLQLSLDKKFQFFLKRMINNIKKIFGTLISKPVEKYQIDWIKRMHAD